MERGSAFILHSSFLYKLSSLYAEEKEVVDYLNQISPKVISHNQNAQSSNKTLTDPDATIAEPLILIDKLIELQLKGEMSSDRVRDQIVTFLVGVSEVK